MTRKTCMVTHQPRWSSKAVHSPPTARCRARCPSVAGAAPASLGWRSLLRTWSAHALQHKLQRMHASRLHGASVFRQSARRASSNAMLATWALLVGAAHQAGSQETQAWRRHCPAPQGGSRWVACQDRDAAAPQSTVCRQRLAQAAAVAAAAARSAAADSRNPGHSGFVWWGYRPSKK